MQVWFFLVLCFRVPMISYDFALSFVVQRIEVCRCGYFPRTSFAVGFGDAIQHLYREIKSPAP